MRVYNQNPQPSALLAAPFGNGVRPIVQALRVISNTPALNSLDTYNLRANSGEPQAILMQHAGADAGPGLRYGNIHYGNGFWANNGSNDHVGVGCSIDSEVAERTKSRVTHSNDTITRISQSTGDGIWYETVIDSFAYDQFVTRQLDDTPVTSLLWNMVPVVFSNIEARSVGITPLGTGTSAIDMQVPHDVDLLVASTINWNVDPADASAEITSYTQTGCGVSLGMAINRPGAPQFCGGYAEWDTWANIPPLRNYHHGIQILGDNRIARAINRDSGEQIEDFNCLITWSGGRPSVTCNQSANGAYLMWMAIKFYSGTQLEIKKSEWPTSGRWVNRNFAFRPDAVIGYHMYGANAWNYPFIPNFPWSSGFHYFDHHDTFTITSSSNNNGTMNDGTAGVSWDNRIRIQANSLGSYDNVAEFSHPRMLRDGFEALPLISPSTPVQSWELAIGY